MQTVNGDMVVIVIVVESNACPNSGILVYPMKRNAKTFSRDTKLRDATCMRDKRLSTDRQD
jgi:hypothetical protein